MAESALGQDDAWLTAYAPPPQDLPPQDTVERPPRRDPQDEWPTQASSPPPPANSALDAPVRDNRDMQVRAPGQNEFPRPALGSRLHPNEAAIYGYENRPPAEGDVVFPSTGYRNAGYRNAYAPQVIDMPDERQLWEFLTKPRTDAGYTPISYAGDTLSPYASGNARLGEPSSVENVKDEMARRFQTMVGAMPPEVKARVDIISGYRDAARQHQVNPGVKDSRHMHGMAMDLGNDPVVLDWIGQNPQYGLGFPLRHMGPKEYNHLEMIDPKTGARMAVTDDHLHEQTGSSTPPQPQAPAAAGADQPKKPLHPIEIFEDAVKEFPIIHSQGLTAGPGTSTEYWPAGEPGTQARPRPSFIPIDQAGMEIGPDAKPLDVLGDVVSHHMVKSDPVIKKTYEDFANSLTGTQKELLQAQYMYYRKNEGETRPYDQWEKSSGLPAYFRGYAFQQWPQDFNKSAYTPQQRYHFDQMMGYLRTGRPQATASLQ